MKNEANIKMNDNICKKILEGLIVTAFIAWMVFMEYAFISILNSSFPLLIWVGLWVMWFSALAFVLAFLILVLLHLDVEVVKNE